MPCSVIGRLTPYSVPILPDRHCWQGWISNLPAPGKVYNHTTRGRYSASPKGKTSIATSTFGQSSLILRNGAAMKDSHAISHASLSFPSSFTSTVLIAPPPPSSSKNMPLPLPAQFQQCLRAFGEDSYKKNMTAYLLEMLLMLFCGTFDFTQLCCLSI